MKGSRIFVAAHIVYCLVAVGYAPAIAQVQYSKQPASDERQQLKQWLDESYEYRFNDPDSSLYYGFRALEVARASSFGDAEADALRSLGTTYQAQGDYPRALAYGLDALRLSRALGDSLKIAHTLNVIGITYDQQGNFPGALSHYREAYDIYKALGDREWLAMMAVNLGVLFKGQGEYEKVIPYYRDAYAIYHKLDLPIEAAFCETNLGAVFYFTHQYDSCVYYSLKAERQLAAHGYLQIQPTAQCNAGLGYFGLGKFKEAQHYLEKALAGHRKYTNKKEIAYVLIQLAGVYQKLGQFGPSLASLLEAKQVAVEIGSAKEAMDASKSLATYYMERNDYPQAYQEYVNYSTIRDTLFEAERVRALANYQIQYETEKKEQQIELLNREAAIQALKLRQHSLLLLIAMGILIAGGIVAYLIVKQRKLKAESRLQQEISAQQEKATRDVLDAEERERRRIAGDLHDGVGQLLSAALLTLKTLDKDVRSGVDVDLDTTARAMDLVRESYDEMRSISHQMLPNALLKSGFVAAVREFIGKLDNRILKVALHISGLDEHMDEKTETALYRVIQEAVNNVIKHARASKLSIQLIRDNEGTDLTIEDNGVGFDPAIALEKGGIGLKNIFSRIALLNGTVDIDATPSRGTVLAIYIPARR